MQEALALLSAALDPTGTICIRCLKAGKPHQNFFAPGDYQGAVNEAARKSQQGFDVYFSTSTFNDNSSAKADNVHAVKCFKVDLDVGPEAHKYPSKREAVGGIIAFCDAHGFPYPVLIDSGGGVHAYWLLDDALDANDGKLYAEKIKAVLLHRQVRIDVTVTGDVARILRVPGTVNHKLPNKPRPVMWRPLVGQTVMEQHDTDTICDLIDAEFALTSAPQIVPASADLLNGVAIPKHLQGVTLDDSTKHLLKGKPKSFKVLLRRSQESGDKGCAQMKWAEDHQASCPEPRWRGALSIAHFCDDGATAIHEISKHHPGYDPAQTEKKASEIKGPYTCDWYRKNYQTQCDGCVHKVTSPIQLGDYVPRATAGDNLVLGQNKSIHKAPVVYTIPEPPFPYFRGKDGGIWIKDGDEDDGRMVCKLDFYMVNVLRGEQEGYLGQFRIHYPQDGVKDFMMDAVTWGSGDKLRETINKNGIMAFDPKEVGSMRSYVARWFEHLSVQKEASVIKTQFGWAEDKQSFVVGDKEIKPYQEPSFSPAAPSIGPIVLACGTKGTLQEWKTVYNVYAQPGFEAHAFCALVGFAAPLVALTDYDGAVINAYSQDSGSGKSTTLLAAASIWGAPDELWMNGEDTLQAIFHRMGVYNNLPICVDEVTDMTEEKMSTFLFMATRGKGRNRMASSANQERVNNTTWNSLILTSANTNFTQKLQAEKNGVDGQLHRLLEPDVRDTGILTKNEADKLFGRLYHNYGHAGEPFIQHVMQNLEQVKLDMALELERLNIDCAFINKERFWSMIGQCVLVGGQIAKDLGLHDYDMDAIRKYFYELIQKSRQRLQYSVHTGNKSDALGEFLNTYSGSTLVVTVDTNLDMTTTIRDPKTNKLVARYERNLNMLYVSRSEFNKFMRDRNANVEQFLDDAKNNNTLIEREKMVRLARGTTLPSTSTRCLVFKLTDDQAAKAD